MDLLGLFFACVTICHAIGYAEVVHHQVERRLDADLLHQLVDEPRHALEIAVEVAGDRRAAEARQVGRQAAVAAFQARDDAAPTNKPLWPLSST